MAQTFDHLTREQACWLLENALSLLPPAKRRTLLGLVPAPPTPAPPREDALTRVVEAAEEIVDYLGDHEAEAAGWIQGNDWDADPDFDADREALEAALEAALVDACAWLATQKPSAALASSLAEVEQAVDDLMAWECEFATGVTYGDLAEGPAHLEAFRIWAVLVAEAGATPEDLAERLATSWPRPPGPSLLAAALRRKAAAVRWALRALADGGVAGAARWLLLEAPDDPALLGRYAHLAPDLGERWSRVRAEAGAWGDLLDAAGRGVAVPNALLYRARGALGRHAEAFQGALGPDGHIDLVEVWDDAIRAGQLAVLREVAGRSPRRAARWIAGSEPELLRLAERYDHEETKMVVAYAVARATGGATSCARSYELPGGLLDRLAVAPGAHDEAACVDLALLGLERMITFHVAARSRSRYARAAAYWAEHGALARRFGRDARHVALQATFAEELRRLPALRDELGFGRRATG